MWYGGIRYEKAVIWADFYHEERWCIFWGHDLGMIGARAHNVMYINRWSWVDGYMWLSRLKYGIWEAPLSFELDAVFLSS